MEIRWAIDNALNFTPHAAAFALAVAGFAVFGRHWPLAVVSLVLVVVAGAYVFRSDGLLAHAEECGPGPRMTIATFNTHNGRADLDALNAYLIEQDVDVLVLQEMTRDATSRSAVLHEQFPYREISRLVTLQVLSRTPLEPLEDFIVAPPPNYLPIARIALTTPIEVDLYALHAESPRAAEQHRLRGLQYAAVLAELGDSSTPVIVAGDMNATVLDPSFASLLRGTNLRSAVSGRRDSPTWSSTLGPFGIRIDHVLQRGFEVCSVQRGPSFGSDHRPLVVEIAESQPD